VSNGQVTDRHGKEIPAPVVERAGSGDIAGGASGARAPSRVGVVSSPTATHTATRVVPSPTPASVSCNFLTNQEHIATHTATHPATHTAIQTASEAVVPSATPALGASKKGVGATLVGATLGGVTLGRGASTSGQVDGGAHGATACTATNGATPAAPLHTVATGTDRDGGGGDEVPRLHGSNRGSKVVGSHGGSKRHAHHVLQHTASADLLLATSAPADETCGGRGGGGGGRGPALPHRGTPPPGGGGAGGRGGRLMHLPP